MKLIKSKLKHWVSLSPSLSFQSCSRTPCVRENNRMEIAHMEHEEAAHLPRTARVQRQPLSCAADTRWLMQLFIVTADKPAGMDHSSLPTDTCHQDMYDRCQLLLKKMGSVLEGQQVPPMAQALGPAALRRLPDREQKWDWLCAGHLWGRAVAHSCRPGGWDRDWSLSLC